MDAPLTWDFDTPAGAMAARRAAVDFARTLGFGTHDAGVVDVVAAELTTNVLRYARGGELRVRRVAGSDGGGPGVQLDCGDRGPGIADLDLAMLDGHSTGGGYGNGLPAVRRLMDEFEIVSDACGTRVTARKWPTVRS
jgi:serine/threonine-protein kinase RsbT